MVTKRTFEIKNYLGNSDLKNQTFGFLQTEEIPRERNSRMENEFFGPMESFIGRKLLVGKAKQMIFKIQYCEWTDIP